MALGPQPRSGNGSVTWVQFESDAVGAQPFRSYEGRSSAQKGIKDNYIRLAVQADAPVRQADGEARWVVEFLSFGSHGFIWNEPRVRSEEHTSEIQSLLRISYDVFCLKTKTNSNSEKTSTSNLITHQHRNAHHE